MYVTVFAFFTYYFTYCPRGVTADAINNKMDLDRPTDRFLSISDLEKSTDRHPGTRDRDFYDSDPYCTRGGFQI